MINKTEAQATVDKIHRAITTIAKSFIAEGATPERALKVATEAVHESIAKEHPHAFAKYVRALQALDAI